MKTVLVVDDNREHLEIVRSALEGAGYRVRVAASGSEAIRAATEQRPDVVLLDLAMPGQSGWEVCRTLRAMPGLARLPIVAMTGHGQLEERLRKPDSGFYGCLIKPFSAAQLADEVQQTLRAHPPSEQ